jgi:hypothetical protein
MWTVIGLFAWPFDAAFDSSLATRLRIRYSVFSSSALMLYSGTPVVFGFREGLRDFCILIFKLSAQKSLKPSSPTKANRVPE